MAYGAWYTEATVMLNFGRHSQALQNPARVLDGMEHDRAPRIALALDMPFTALGRRYRRS